MLAVVVLVGCARGTVEPDGMTPARCGGELPAWAAVEAGALVARTSAVEVTVAPLADGLVKLRYTAPGAVADPSFAVVEAPTVDGEASFGGDGDAALACTAALVVRVAADGRVRVARSDGGVLLDDAAPFAAGRLERAAGADRVYGLGERTGGLDKRGRAWTFWNTDAYDPAHGGWAPGQDPLYQSIPFEVRIPRAGGAAFGVFTDEPRRMTFDLGATDAARDTIVASGARTLEQYVFAGPRMADVVERYTRLVGRPALPPRWALGFHQSRWGYSGADLEAVAARLRSERLPATALWLDIQHMDGFRSFTFDDRLFPPGTLERIAAQGYRIVAIEDPGIKVDPAYDVYASGVAGGHFVRGPDGAPFQGTAWPGASAFPDFSRAATRAWWGEQVTRIAGRGVTGIWLDVNEPTTFPEGGGGNTLPDELAVDGDGTPRTMAAFHNAYALLQAKATYEALAARGSRPLVLSRAGYAGIQRYAAVWTGDTPSTWDGLAQTLPMLLGLGVSGVPIVGSDIGGYSGHATPELYARWLALGSVSPFARAHVTQGVPGQEPWMFGPEVLDITRARLGDRERLAPYLYALADEAARTGAPILRPLVWEFPDDPAVADLGDQAMLGPSILVAPIAEPDATSRRVYLPAGRWYELHSDAILDGPTTIDVPVTLAALPMYVRAGAIIPTTDGVQLYPGATPATFTLYDDDGETLTGGTRTTLELTALADGAQLVSSDPAHTLTVRVHRVDGAVTGVDGATAFARDAATRTLEATGAGTLRFHYDPAIGELAPPVPVTFEVAVPADTPMGTPIHVATSSTGWTHAPLARISPTVARGTVELPRGVWFDYKYTRGGWETVEKLGNCGEALNRYRFAAPSSQADTVATWRDRCGT